MQDYALGKFHPISKAVEVAFYYQVFGEDGVIRTGEFGIKKDRTFYFM